ncbi:hypothetical protein HMPREF0072_0607, partial [Anaerococcus lactolyticus ATCC 51172]
MPAAVFGYGCEDMRGAAAKSRALACHVLRAAIALKPVAVSGGRLLQVPAGSADHAQLAVLDDLHRDACQ